MITKLDEAIKHCKEVAEEKEKLAKTYESFKDYGNPKSSITSGHKSCLNCAEEHRQLAEWLTELAERREADRWIPVSERLPKEKINPNTHDFEEVLCTTIWGDVRVYKFGKPIGYDTAHFWHGSAIMDEYIVAWQPLSKPYESEDNENETSEPI